jgi:hypothetical protein
MCEIITYQQVKNYDPTMTTRLRNTFAKDINKRFLELAVVIKKSVYNNDCFGLKLQTNQMQPVPQEELKYKPSPEKVALFLVWLQQQMDRGILSIDKFQDPWTNKYVLEAYKRGVLRARQELAKAGYKVPTI